MKKIIINPAEEHLLEFGYKKFIEEKMPEYDSERFVLVPVYTENDTEIVLSWETAEKENEVEE